MKKAQTKYQIFVPNERGIFTLIATVYSIPQFNDIIINARSLYPCVKTLTTYPNGTQVLSQYKGAIV